MTDETYVKILESEINHYHTQIKKHRQRIAEATAFIVKNSALINSIEKKLYTNANA